MEIIPVIDLKNGSVVHAKQGNRDDYQPLKSELCPSADIYTVVQTFVNIYKFKTIYIADLNAITGQQSHAALIDTVLNMFPQVTFWLDVGYPLANRNLLTRTNFVAVLGSESFRDDTLAKLKSFGNAYILSLDFSIAGELGAKSLFKKTELWPERIIIMTLPRVGSNLGPDVEKLQYYRNLYPKKTIIAAGGVRNYNDLQELTEIGVDHALIATALHNGQLSPQDIANLQAKKYPD